MLNKAIRPEDAAVWELPNPGVDLTKIPVERMIVLKAYYQRLQKWLRDGRPGGPDKVPEFPYNLETYHEESHYILALNAQDRQSWSLEHANVPRWLEEALKKAKLITPPSARQWWQNCRHAYDDTPGATNAERWLTVGHKVRLRLEAMKQASDPNARCDYLTPRMAKNWTKRLSERDIDKSLAANLRSRVEREERKHKTATA